LPAPCSRRRIDASDPRRLRHGKTFSRPVDVDAMADPTVEDAAAFVDDFAD
jgi:hypothetical protein